MCLACFDAIFYLAKARALEGEDESLVYLGGGFDPFVVGSWETGGGVDECPHYEGAGRSEDCWVC